MNRRSRPTLRVLLKTAARFKSGDMTEADRQLISVILSGIAKDRDARDYFFESISARPKEHNPAAECAAMLYVIAEHRDDKLGMRNKSIQRKTGLSKDQVDNALKEHGWRARKDLEAEGLELAELLLHERLEELRQN